MSASESYKEGDGGKCCKYFYDKDLCECTQSGVIVYADPPWEQEKGGRRAVRRNQWKSLDYPCLTLAEIEKIVRSFACGNTQTIFLWTIDKYLHAAEEMFKDYRLHARLIWDKENGVAPAFTVRYSHEYLLWLYKGKFNPVDKSARGKFTTVIRERSQRHSQKPESAYHLIEALYPNERKIELFARRKRNGWESWGNEV